MPTQATKSKRSAVSDTETCKFCFIVGRPRSGTTVFKKMLATHPRIHNFGEIFNENNKKSYWSFLKAQARLDEDAILPSRSVKNFLDYLESLRADIQSKRKKCSVILLDIKYDQSHHICGPWHDMNALPKIFSLIRQNGWSVIDIHRQDLVGLVVSNLVAMETKTYHSTKSRPQPSATPAKVKVNVKGLLREMRITKDAYARLQNAFTKYPNYLKIDYEDMFDPATGSFARPMIDRLVPFFGLADRFDAEPKLQKVLKRDVFEYVENADEVRAAVRTVSQQSKALQAKGTIPATAAA